MALTSTAVEGTINLLLIWRAAVVAIASIDDIISTRESVCEYVRYSREKMELQLTVRVLQIEILDNWQWK